MAAIHRNEDIMLLIHTCLHCGQEYIPSQTTNENHHDSYACHRYQAILCAEREGTPVTLWAWDSPSGRRSFGFTRTPSNLHLEYLADTRLAALELIQPTDRIHSRVYNANSSSM